MRCCMLARQPKSGRWAVSWPGEETEREHRYPHEWSSGALPACTVVRQARYRPPAHRVWLDWTATVPQPQNGRTLFVIEISCLSVSVAGHKNAWQNCDVVMANWRSSCDNDSSEPTLHSWSRGSTICVLRSRNYIICVPRCLFHVHKLRLELLTPNVTSCVPRLLRNCISCIERYGYTKCPTMGRFLHSFIVLYFIQNYMHTYRIVKWYRQRSYIMLLCKV